jgi:hypothetical protein
VQDLLVAQKRDRPAYCFQHLDLELRSQNHDLATVDAGRTSSPPAPRLLPAGMS